MSYLVNPMLSLGDASRRRHISITMKSAGFSNASLAGKPSAVPRVSNQPTLAGVKRDRSRDRASVPKRRSGLGSSRTLRSEPYHALVTHGMLRQVEVTRGMSAATFFRDVRLDGAPIGAVPRVLVEALLRNVALASGVGTLRGGELGIHIGSCHPTCFG
jgi:hypothetical protein